MKIGAAAQALQNLIKRNKGKDTVEFLKRVAKSRRKRKLAKATRKRNKK
jgi:hypothetical protein